MVNHIASLLPRDRTISYGIVRCYWTVVIAQLSAVDPHVKSTIQAVDREKHPNDVLVHFV